MAKEGKKQKITSLDDFERVYTAQRVDIKQLIRNAGFWSTGSFKLDRFFGGGFPKGKMIEVYGPPHSGKTTVALKAAGVRLKQGGRVHHYDLERALDLANEDVFDANGMINADLLAARGDITMEEVHARASWLRKNGINPQDPNYRIYDPENGEQLFEMLGHTITNNLADLVIVDSVPAIMPGKVLDGLPGEATYGSRAKLLAEELPRLLSLYRDNPNTTIIWINQVRENIGAQVKSQKSTGGFALDHYVGAKFKVQKISKTEQGNDVITEALVKNDKNRFNSALKEIITISGMRGLDTLGEMLEVGIDFGYVQKSGNWHYFFDGPIDADAFKIAQAKKTIPELPGFVHSVNGEGGALAWMAQNGWEDKLFSIAAKAYGKG